MGAAVQEKQSTFGRIKKWRKIIIRAGKYLGVTALVFGVFLVGMGVGNGAITVGGNQNTQNKDLPADLDFASVEDLYDELKANYDGKLDTEKLLDGIKTGLAEASGDQYTVYLNAKDAEEFNKQLQGTFSGIGAELGQDASGNLIVVAPIADYPAAKAGLRSQDIIVSVDGKSTAGMSVEEAVTKIRGPKGTQVKLQLLRDKKDEINVTITRENIKVPSVKHEVIDGVGYIQINQFSEDTDELAREAAADLKSKGVRGIVLDLRGNPGGLLDSAVGVSSLWLAEGKTVLQERRDGLVVATYRASGDNILEGMPTAVLINEGSASASEITAGALKDHKAATLYGVKSFGKGSVQQIQQLPGGAELKVTIARWYRPNGQNIDKKGINPDKEIKMSEDDYKNKRDPQKDAAIELLKK